MPGWDSFFVAEIGAAAALAGLIFVGVSINLSKILSVGGLPGRALEALMLLLAVLVISSLMLMPDQSITYAALEVLVGGILIWVGMLMLQIRNLSNVDEEYRPRFAQSIIYTQIATFPYIIAGVWMLIQGADGLYWIVPAILLSFITALMNAWVLLVEINR